MAIEVSILDILERAGNLRASDVILMGNDHISFKVYGKWLRQYDWPPLEEDGVARLLEDLLPKHMHEKLFGQKEGARKNVDEFPREGEDLNLEDRSQEQETIDASIKGVTDYDFSVSLPSGDRYRVNLYLTGGRYGAVLRPIPKQPPALEDLGLPEATVRTIRGELLRKGGMMLVTGATGSGKSTTLAAMIEWINHTAAYHIVTIEDPIEFFFSPKKSIFSQREVGKDVPSFARALKSALRQAPDIIMVGEMRDLETIQAALTAAETGHLVLGTLHTRSAPASISRIIDVFPDGYREMVRQQLASSLRFVISQALLPKATGGGRVLVAEAMVNTPAIANLIRTGKVDSIKSDMFKGKELGMFTMAQHARDLIRKGLITEEVALTVVDKKDLTEIPV